MRRHRVARGLSQEELAGLIEPPLSVNTIGNVERGRTRPYRHTLDGLAAALDLDDKQRNELLAAWKADAAVAADSIRVASARAATGRESAPPTAEPPRHNLPAEVTSFVGRQHELARGEELLAGTRLLTLTGAGGCGKTRLALRLGSRTVSRYPDGVWLVELAPVGRADLVPSRVATALSVPEEPGRTVLAALQMAIATRRLLLVLDNCEHLIAACARLAEALLRACPEVAILATSREALGIAGETTWRVPSLSAPGPRERVSPADAQRYESIQLFVARARHIAPHFNPTEENAAALAHICRRLDGVPLALELAAARTRVLSVGQIANGLDDRFRLLTGGGRTAPRRQQTLRASIDWSHDLLEEPERALLRRLSAFAAGWTLEAAEAVAVEPTEPVDVLEGLTGLVDKSLVTVDESGGECRYELLETMRQYAAEKLVEAGETAGARGRHRDWYLGFAEEAAGGMTGPEQRRWLDQLEREHDNLRAALDFCIGTGDATAGLRLATALEMFWYYHGHGPEAWSWVTRLIELAGPSPREPGLAVARARTLTVAHHLAANRQDMEVAGQLIEEAVSELRALDDDVGLRPALARLSSWRTRQGRYADAHALAVEGLDVARRLGKQAGIYQVGFNVGISAFTAGDLVEAQTRLEECLAIGRSLGQPSSIARPLEWLANVALARGEPAAAETGYREALALYSEAGDRYGIAHAVQGLGLVAVERGNPDAAERLLQDCLRAQAEIVDQRWLPTTLDGLAGAVALRIAAAGVPAAERAIRLAGAAETVRAPFGGGWRHPPEVVLRRWIAPALAALGTPAAERTAAAGRALETGEAIALAMSEAQ